MTYIALAFLMILLLLWLVVLMVAAQMFFKASVGVVTKKYAPEDGGLPVLRKAVALSSDRYFYILIAIL